MIHKGRSKGYEPTAKARALHCMRPLAAEGSLPALTEGHVDKKQTYYTISFKRDPGCFCKVPCGGYYFKIWTIDEKGKEGVAPYVCATPTQTREQMVEQLRNRGIEAVEVGSWRT